MSVDMLPSSSLIKVGVLTCHPTTGHIRPAWAAVVNPLDGNPRRTGMVMSHVWDGEPGQAEDFSAQYGAEVVDVQIKRTDLPDGAPLQSAFQRMQSDRQREARTIRAQGDRDARIIRAEADASAARIYAESFGKDPDFYDFYRAMQSYNETFRKARDGEEPRGDSNIILSPDNEYLRQFRGRR